MPYLSWTHFKPTKITHFHGARFDMKANTWVLEVNEKLKGIIDVIKKAHAMDKIVNSMPGII